jgi:hypothetical protein
MSLESSRDNHTKDYAKSNKELTKDYRKTTHIHQFLEILIPGIIRKILLLIVSDSDFTAY